MGQIIQSQIQLQNVHARLTQQAKLPALNVFGHQVADNRFIHSARTGDSRHLHKRRRWVELRIEAAGRGSHQIDRD